MAALRFPVAADTWSTLGFMAMLTAVQLDRGSVSLAG